MANRFALSHILAFSLATICHSEDAPSVLMVLTSNDKLGDADGKTGFYLPEAAHPWAVFKKAGAKMTWASPKGGAAPVDPDSIAAYCSDNESVEFLNDQKDLYTNTKKLADMDPKDFDAVFVVGGYGVMWDLVGDKDLEKIAAGIFEDGGVVSGVCHGPAALVNVKLSDGTFLIKDKEVACFTNAEEDVLKRRDVVPKTCEDSLKAAGANYTKGAPWSDHVALAGRLVTGQNPQSAHSTAADVLKVLVDDTEQEHTADAKKKANAAANVKNAEVAENAESAEKAVNAMNAKKAKNAQEAETAVFAEKAEVAKYAKTAENAEHVEKDGKVHEEIKKEMAEDLDAEAEKKAKEEFVEEQKKIGGEYEEAMKGDDATKDAEDAKYAKNAENAKMALNAMDADVAMNAAHAEEAKTAEKAQKAKWAESAVNATYALEAKNVAEKFLAGMDAKGAVAKNNGTLFMSFAAVVCGAVVIGLGVMTRRMVAASANPSELYSNIQEDEMLGLE